jgi:hypothetical protein
LHVRKKEKGGGVGGGGETRVERFFWGLFIAKFLDPREIMGTINK